MQQLAWEQTYTHTKINDYRNPRACTPDLFYLHSHCVINFLLGLCDSIEQFSCYNSNDCVRHDQRCDGTDNCRQGEDEEFCCLEPTFGCYVDVSDRPDSYGGASNRQIYQCLESLSRCDGVPDCVDQSDENNCKLTLLL